jgi:transposase
VNEIRGFLNEYGIIAPRGRRVFAAQFLELMFKHEDSLSTLTRETLYELWKEYNQIDERIKGYEQKLKRFAADLPVCTRLMGIPGIGFITATALFAAVGDARVFKNGRELAAWLGITPREHSTGGKQRLLGISKRGDSYLRKLLIHGARITLQYAARKNDRASQWANDLKQRKGTNRAAVALANKNARIVWALITKQEEFREFQIAA